MALDNIQQLLSIVVQVGDKGLGKLDKAENRIKQIRNAQIALSRTVGEYARAQELAADAVEEYSESAKSAEVGTAKYYRAILELLRASKLQAQVEKQIAAQREQQARREEREAQKRAREAEQIRRNQQQQRIGLAQLLIAQGRYAEAEARLRNALDRTNSSSAEGLRIRRLLVSLDERRARVQAQAQTRAVAEGVAQAKLARAQGDTGKAIQILNGLSQRANITDAQRTRILRELTAVQNQQAKAAAQAAKANGAGSGGGIFGTIGSIAGGFGKAFFFVTRILAATTLITYVINKIGGLLSAVILRPLEAIVSATLKTTEEFRRVQATLVGVVGSLSKALEIQNDITSAIQKGGLPITTLEGLQGIRSLAFTPALAGSLARGGPEREDRIGQILKILTGLATIDPEQGIAGAQFALREALSGEFRSLRFRFELSPQTIAAAIGKNLQDLKGDPELVVQALKVFVDQFVGADAISRFQDLLSTQAKLFRGALEEFFLLIGDSGIYDRITAFFKKANATLRGGLTPIPDNYVELNARSEAPLQAVAEAISASLSGLFDTIINALSIALSAITDKQVDLATALDNFDVVTLGKVFAEVIDTLASFAGSLALLLADITGDLSGIAKRLGIIGSDRPITERAIRDRIGTLQSQLARQQAFADAGAPTSELTFAGRLANSSAGQSFGRFGVGLASFGSGGALEQETELGTSIREAQEELAKLNDRLKFFPSNSVGSAFGVALGGGNSKVVSVDRQIRDIIERANEPAKLIQRIEATSQQLFNDLPEERDLNDIAGQFADFRKALDKIAGPKGRIAEINAEADRGVASIDNLLAVLEIPARIAGPGSAIADLVNKLKDRRTGLTGARNTAIRSLTNSLSGAGSGILGFSADTIQQLAPRASVDQALDILRAGANRGRAGSALPFGTNQPQDFTFLARTADLALNRVDDLVARGEKVDGVADSIRGVTKQLIDMTQAMLDAGPQSEETFTQLINAQEQLQKVLAPGGAGGGLSPFDRQETQRGIAARVQAAQEEAEFSRLNLDYTAKKIDAEKFYGEQKRLISQSSVAEIDALRQQLYILTERQKVQGNTADTEKAILEVQGQITVKEIENTRTLLELDRQRTEEIKKQAEARRNLLAQFDDVQTELEARRLDSLDRKGTFGPDAAIIRRQAQFTQELRGLQDLERQAKELGIALDLGPVYQKMAVVQEQELQRMLEQYDVTLQAMKEIGENFATNVTDTFSSAFSDTLVDIFDGTANDIESIMRNLAQAISRIIADTIADLTIRQGITQLFSALGLLGSGAAPQGTYGAGGNLAGPPANVPAIASGARFGTSVNVVNAATGILTRPNTLIRTVENGAPEAVVPLNGGGVPVRWMDGRGGREQPPVELTILNYADPRQIVESGVRSNRNVIINPVVADMAGRGKTHRQVRIASSR